MFDEHEEMYGEYDFSSLVRTGSITIKTGDICEENWRDYCTNLLNVFKDYIETWQLQSSLVTFVFDNGESIELSASMALINICMWGFIVNTHRRIQPEHLVFKPDGITSGFIKKYIDLFCVIPSIDLENSTKLDFFKLNNTIYTCLRSLKFVDKFARFFNNTINIKDFIDLMNSCPEAYDIMHKDYSNIPPDKMNAVALEDTNRLISLIIDSEKYMGREHCLADALRAKVGIKPKQFRELITNIGIKPNGEGGVIPYPENTSFISDGITNPYWYYSEVVTGREAQILNKKNTADSGAFSRAMMMNCSSAKLYTKPGTSEIDRSYDCHTRNFVKFEVKNEKILSMIPGRYYRLNKHGIEYKTHNNYEILEKDRDLIGKTIYLRSPITCRSAALGKGICRKCFGELYNIFPSIYIGAYSVPCITQDLIQKMLSAKHLLEAAIIATVLIALNVDTQQIEEIIKYILFENGTVSVNPDISDIKKWELIIANDDITDEVVFSINDDGDDSFQIEDDEFEDSVKYTNVFYLHNVSTGKTIEIKGSNFDNLYLTQEIMDYVSNKNYLNDDEDVIIPLVQLINTPLFDVGIHNDDMSEKLNSVIKCINLKAVTESFNKDELLGEFINRLLNVGNYTMSVHAEVIIMCQIRDKDDILSQPDWDIPDNENYQILTLKKALANHPSITVACQGDDIAKTLVSPSSFRKTEPSRYDLLFHVQPQQYIKQDGPELPVGSVFTYDED